MTIKSVSITTHRGRAGLSLVLLRQGANVVELRGPALRELLAAVTPRGPADDASVPVGPAPKPKDAPGGTEAPVPEESAARQRWTDAHRKALLGIDIPSDAPPSRTPKIVDDHLRATKAVLRERFPDLAAQQRRARDDAARAAFVNSVLFSGVPTDWSFLDPAPRREGLLARIASAFRRWPPFRAAGRSPSGARQ